MHSLSLPQAERVDALTAVADHRHIIRNSHDLLIAEGNLHGFFFAADAPRVAEARPIVRTLSLEAVVEVLLEQAVAIPQAKAVKRQAVRSGGIEEACGQTAQAAVAERVVLDLLEDGGINSVFLQVLIAFIEEAEIQQIVVDQAAYQELSGKVACTLLLLRFVPSLGKLRHSGAGDGLIKLLDGGGRGREKSLFLQIAGNVFRKTTHRKSSCLSIGLPGRGVGRKNRLYFARRPYKAVKSRILAASSSVQLPGETRQRQFCPRVEGVLIRASLPRPRKSCSGMTARAATLW